MRFKLIYFVFELSPPVKCMTDLKANLPPLTRLCQSSLVLLSPATFSLANIPPKDLLLEEQSTIGAGGRHYLS